LVKCINGDTILIEVKPQRLMDRVKDNQLKQESCEIYCKKFRNWKYELWTEEKLDEI